MYQRFRAWFTVHKVLNVEEIVDISEAKKRKKKEKKREREIIKEERKI